MTALTIFLIAVSLSMDAFAVSVCGGMRLAEDRKFRGGLQYGAWFGIFQALMLFRLSFGPVFCRLGRCLCPLDHFLDPFLDWHWNDQGGT